MVRYSTGPGKFGPAYDFVTVGTLVHLGWNMSVRTFHVLAVVGYALALPVVTGTAAVIAVVVRALLDAEQMSSTAQGRVVAVVVALLNVYCVAGYWFREAFTARRFTVGGSPNAALLRAVDVPALALFTAACIVRAVVFFSLLTLATFAAVLVFAEPLHPPLAAALALIPVVSCLGLLAVTSRYAARNTRQPPRIQGRYALGSILIVAGSGYLLAKTVTAAVATSTEWGLPEPTGWVGSSTALGLMIAALGWAVWGLRSGLRELSQHSFEIPQTVHRVVSQNARSQNGSGPAGLVGVLHRELTHSKTYFLLQKTALLLALGIAFLGGLALGDSGFIPVSTGQSQLTRLVLAITFVSSLTAVDIVLRVCGPGTLRHQLRYAWDCGAPVHRMIPAAVTYWIFPGVLIGTAATLSLHLLVGGVTFRPLFIGVGVAASSLLAGGLSVVPRSNCDGSSDTSLFVALLTVILAIPALVVFLSSNTWVVMVGVLYVLLLSGGANVWVTKNVRVLRSS